MDDQEQRHVFDNPRNVKLVLYGLYLSCGLLLLADFFVDRHGVHPWEALISFYCLYGFGACVILVLLAKEMRKLLMRADDYYDG